MIESIVFSASQATMDVCRGGDFDDVDIETVEHYQFEHVIT